MCGSIKLKKAKQYSLLVVAMTAVPRDACCSVYCFPLANHLGIWEPLFGADIDRLEDGAAAAATAAGPAGAVAASSDIIPAESSKVSSSFWADDTPQPVTRFLKKGQLESDK